MRHDDATSGLQLDDGILRQLRACLADPTTSREAATSALALAADHARREPAIAAIIAERIRTDRGQRRHDAYLPLSTPRRTIDDEDAASAVGQSGCASLAATAMLAIEEHERGCPHWARALVAVAGDSGRAHLARMRVRPGWSEYIPSSEPPPEGLDALVSPIADIRSPAIDALVARAEHLRAFLLSVELDRYIRGKVLRTWLRPVSERAWLPLLSTHTLATNFDRQLARLPPGLTEFGDQVALMKAQYLLDKIIEAGGGRAPMRTEQEMTPALRELEADGVVAFAARYMPDPRLTSDERAELEAAEAQLAAAAVRWAPELA